MGLMDEGGPLARMRSNLGTRFEPGGDGDADPLDAFVRALRDDREAGEEFAAIRAWLGRVRPARAEWRQRTRELLEALASLGPPDSPTGPQVPTPWVPIGPAVLRRGQAVGEPAMAGRIADIAVAPGHERVYACTATGGVWRSDHGGRFWRPTMDTVDRDDGPTGSLSLSGGGIAVDPGDPDRVFVMTGEEHHGHDGVGPLRSTNGGVTWTPEPSDPAQGLEGEGCYGLILDPADAGRQQVLAAMTNGIWRRESDGAGGFVWKRVRAGGRHSGIAVGTRVDGSGTRTTRWAAARSHSQVWQSPSGDSGSWTVLGTNFPTGNIGRIGVAMHPGNPDVVYALIERGGTDNKFRGLFRFDAGSGTTDWVAIDEEPNTPGNWSTGFRDVFGGSGRGQGWYDLAMAVDPRNVDRIYIAGKGDASGAAVYRIEVTRTGSGASTAYTNVTTNIGREVHPDVHCLLVDPTDSDRLWVGCDGGIFLSTDARSLPDPTFRPMNTGLQVLQLHHLGPHPDLDGVMFAGTQDNGTIRYTGEEVWLHSAGGDGGWAFVHWGDPYKVARTYVREAIDVTTNGGPRWNHWADRPAQSGAGRSAEFYAPMVGTPKVASGGDPDRLAFGGDRVQLSDDFGSNWNDIGTSLGAGNALSLLFASHTVLYAGTTGGRVRRYAQSGATWTETNLAGPPSRPWPVTDIAVDPSNVGAGIWITYGGSGAGRDRVWHYDGSTWSAKPGSAAAPGSGTTRGQLVDAVFHSIETDPDHPDHVYAGSDVGLWFSDNRGAGWVPLANGLPEAPVWDIRLHRPSRVLRVATHGRGAWERKLDTAFVPKVELYVRDTQIDSARGGPSATSGNDPTNHGGSVAPGRSPDIRVDAPRSGYAHPTENIDCLQFVDELTDESDQVATVARAAGIAMNRVYVQVHNRGVPPARDVQVVCLLAEMSGGNPPALPAGYEAHVAAGTPIPSGTWRTLGREVLRDVRAGLPQVAAFELPSTYLPEPGSLSGHDQWCVLVLMHHAEDRWIGSTTDVAALSRDDRKAAWKKLRVRRHTGALPYPRTHGWARMQPLIKNWPVNAGPPTFRIFGQENGSVVVELAWDPQALLAPSIGYDDAEAMRYYATSLDFDKTITKADGTALRVRVPPQPLSTLGTRLEWTMPAALWAAYQAEAAKAGAGGAFPRTLYYRVRLTPTGSDTAILWPPDSVVHNNPTAPHLGVIAPLVAGTRPPLPDPAAVAAMADPLWRDAVTAAWNDLPEANADRQALVRIFGHRAFQEEMGPAARARVLELWLIAGPSARSKLDDLLDRRVILSPTRQTVPMAMCADFQGSTTLVEHLLSLRWLVPHPDLVGVTSNEQLLDDVLTELIDPNGQMNQGDSGMAPTSALQNLLIHVVPGEYVRLVRGLLSAHGRATLANGDTLSIPPAIFQVARYGGAQTDAFRVRTNSELAFQSAVLKYGQGDRFPEYDPEAAPDADNGVATVFAATIRGGMRKSEMERALEGIWGSAFRSSGTGPSASLASQLTSALEGIVHPILLTLRWAPRAANPDARGHTVLAMRHENGRVFFKNPEYAGSAPPATHTAGATPANPPRRVEDPNQTLESISDSDLGAWILWYHVPG